MTIALWHLRTAVQATDRGEGFQEHEIEEARNHLRYLGASIKERNEEGNRGGEWIKWPEAVE